MRKPRKMTAEETAPYIWELPPDLYGRWGDPTKAADAPPVEMTPIDWPQLFGNANPVEIEVGFGKGLFLITSATAHPERNYFGIEIVRKYQLYAATRIAGRRMPNVKTSCADAKLVLDRFVPPGSVSVVHVFFPDPWWKTRHKKRLLFTPEFAALVHRVLIPGGRLHFVTDVQDYFEWVTGTLVATPGFRPLPPPQESAPTHDLDYLTNFERKFRQQGLPIYRSLYEKV
ncbi:tRNA (guanosine(46)-N7)-methyltransferase TrmB [Limnoglobus roseus]|uniref:tRNA (guanine-N(7)-)-methyltransferase n=1 Tax=Limnoglobus roseus TaxID=2598579 RepID=A0A5C1ALU5_9BACT|nr:tRNA (guanosine(46)-N7)-methyltransferase TrmB [Limnoglobus roseus]QEL20389.1 tRNA (guanosine(46)-N7)-methyltransferase TrmB [Limnoglobus roseus]